MGDGDTDPAVTVGGGLQTGLREYLRHWGWGMLAKLHEMGVRSEHLYAAGVASIGLTFVMWLASRKKEDAGTDRADRWGIFIGQWAPTLFAAGNGLRSYETH